MKTNVLKHFFFTVLTLFIISCDKDETEVTENEQKEQEQIEEPEEPEENVTDPTVVLAEERETVINSLTNGNQQTWKITEAILTNNSGTFNISNNFNVIDDELIFINEVFAGSKTDFNGTLEWRPGNFIETEASTIEETLVDYYESPFKTSFDFVSESSANLESPGFTFTYVDENTITGTVLGEGSSTIDIILSPKTVEDYVQVPTETLSFSPAFTYPSNAVSGMSPGMTGSNSSNSIYIVTREDGMRGSESMNPERVSKFDLENGNLTDQLFFQGDFVSKQLHIIDNKLKVVGGQYINTYDLGLQTNPTSVSYEGQIALSRHGSAVINDEIFIVGGSLGDTQNVGNEIYKWDDLNSSLSLETTMPEIRSGARAETVQSKLYVFGGTEEFVGQNAKNTIYIYDFETGDLSTETMPSSVHFTYTGKHENLIIVGGQIKTFTDDADADGNPDGFLTQVDNDPYLGVYNTLNNEFTELSTNLTSSENETIHSMTVINGKIYILYGQQEEVAEGEFQNWDVLVADLN